MNSHAHVLVSLDAPEAGQADVGRFAEALLRYDRVSVLASHPEALAMLLDWFVSPGEIETLLIWLRDGAVDFVDPQGDFTSRVLEHASVARVMQGQHRHARLKSFGKVSQVRADASLQAAGNGAATTLDIAHRLAIDVVLSPPQSRQVRAQLDGLPGFQTFDAGVKFPPVRRLVNEGRMDLRAVVDLRRDARPIRAWMQLADRGTLQQFVALHDQIGRASVWREPGVLSVFGAIQRALPLATDLWAAPDPIATIHPDWAEAFAGAWRPWIFEAA